MCRCRLLVAALASCLYRSSFNDPELDFGENRIDLSYGRKALPYTLRVGASYAPIRDAIVRPDHARECTSIEP